MGHWIIDWNRTADPLDPDTWVITTAAHGGNSNFGIRPVPDGDGVDQDVRFLGNEPMAAFLVHKTDYRMYQEMARSGGNPNWNNINGYLLPGAQFILLRYNNLESGNSPTDILVTPAMLGDAEGEWSVVWEGTSTNVLGTPMNMPLDTRFTYFQLIESVPPPGFQMPPSQWRIELRSNTATNPNPALWSLLHAPFRTHWVRVRSIGDVVNPAFHRNPNGVWYVGNLRNIELPLMGGAGRTTFFIGGVTVIALGLGLLVYIYIGKKYVYKLAPVKARVSGVFKKK